MALQQTFLSYNKEVYPHYYLCHYLPMSAGRDTLSHSLLKFKQSRQPDLEGWIDCALEILEDAPIPPGATVVRALHHHETSIPDSPVALDLLGQQLAAHFHHHYHPRLLRKAHPTLPVKAFSRPKREEEMQDLYFIDPSYAATLPESPPDHWLVIDDIHTTGATIRAIIGSIRQTYPLTPISIFTLARAGAVTPPENPTGLKGKHYQLEQNRNWTVAETPLPYYSLLQLKTMIRSDVF